MNNIIKIVGLLVSLCVATFSKEITGTVLENGVELKTCTHIFCPQKETLKKGDKINIIALDKKYYKTDNGLWVKKIYVQLENTKKIVKVKNNYKALKKVVDKAQIANISPKTPTSKEELSQNNYNEKNLLIIDPQFASKYKNEALIANLTKTPSKLPVMKSPKYARMLLMPIINENGNIYTDYTYIWVKIKNEEFVLGKRESKNNLQNNYFTIHKIEE